MSGLLGRPLKAVNAGVELFATELERQQTEDDGDATTRHRTPPGAMRSAGSREPAHSVRPIRLAESRVFRADDRGPKVLQWPGPSGRE